MYGILYVCLFISPERGGTFGNRREFHFCQEIA